MFLLFLVLSWWSVTVYETAVLSVSWRRWQIDLTVKIDDEKRKAMMRFEFDASRDFCHALSQRF
jgi:hypothetical protein